MLIGPISGRPGEVREWKEGFSEKLRSDRTLVGSCKFVYTTCTAEYSHNREI
jgi:hypothetical protein